jgi:putative nucleotidyltransferase with HDIG domain
VGISSRVICKDGKPVYYEGIVRDITERKITEKKLKESYQKLQKTLSDVINTLASIVESKDPYTSGHQKRVAMLATAISEELGLDQEKIESIRIAALIHDIGKINIPVSILTRPGRLSEIEYDMIKTHSQLGHDMISRVEFPWPIADIILQHHERINGSGYPRGLKGKDIILEARILAVADVVEAMASHRPYRPALGMDKALEEINKGKGKLYDPEVADTCNRLIKNKRFNFTIQFKSQL